MKIGEGGFGTVYKALLPGGQVVAIKRAKKGMAEYQMPLFREIDGCLKAKCDKLADAFEIDDIDISSGNQSSSARLPERVNVTVGEGEERMMMTGLQAVADVFCVGCGSILGWKYWDGNTRLPMKRAKSTRKICP